MWDCVLHVLSCYCTPRCATPHRVDSSIKEALVQDTALCMRTQQLCLFLLIATAGGHAVVTDMSAEVRDICRHLKMLCVGQDST